MSLEFSFIMYYAEANQERIVEAGGLTSLLMLLRSFDDETICRVAAGAIANLAMNGNFLFAYVRISTPDLPFNKIYRPNPLDLVGYVFLIALI